MSTSDPSSLNTWMSQTVARLKEQLANAYSSISSGFAWGVASDLEDQQRGALDQAQRYITRLDGEPKAILADLEARGMNHVYVDGGDTIQRFLRAGVIDRMTVTRVPVLIGEGIPLFGPLAADVKLKHVETRTFPSGLVQTVYVLDSPA